jgi:hypothetical protein
MSKLNGRVAIITGARRGIGAGIARVMAEYGASVVATDVAIEVEATAEDIRKKGLDAVAYKMDVTSPGEVNKVVQQVLDKFGKIEILVNNAGIYPAQYLTDMSDAFLLRLFDINVFGVFRCTRAVLPTMIKQRYGKIVNMSSVTGPLVSEGGQTAYSASKAAVWGFTTSLALEVAQYGLNVNSICPSYVDTEGAREPGPDKSTEDLGKTIPFGRKGTSEEIGELAAFLASDESRYITGTHVVIDGGNIIQETYRGPYTQRLA